MNIAMMNTSTAMLDRVELSIYNFGISKISISEFHSLRKAIGENLFRTAKHFTGNSVYTSISLQHVYGRGYLKYLPHTQSCNLTLSIKLNPTRMLKYDFFSEESIRKKKSLDGKDNFVPHFLQFMWGRERLQKRSIELLADKIQSIISEFTYCIDANVARYIRIHRPQLSWKLIEVYWDIYNRSPYSYINLLKPQWMSYFIQPQCPHYSSLRSSEQLVKSSYGLIGINRVGEKFKVYGKDLNLVRHEAEYKRRRIRSLCKTNVMSLATSKSIYSFLEPLASDAMKVFQEIELPEYDDSDAPITFKPLYEVARACGRDAVIFDIILNELKFSSRLVSRPMFYTVIPRLLKRRVIKRTGRGIYHPSAELLSLIEYMYNSSDN